ncbi:MAG TPA: hypothetical protein VGB38_06950, partial [bacterium]
AAFSLWSLVLQVIPFVLSIPKALSGSTLKPDIWISGICGLVLLVLAVWLMAEAVQVLGSKKQAADGRRQ